MAFGETTGWNKLAHVLVERMRKENASPLVLDFGEIQANESLITNTFPTSIPKGEYSILRSLTLGKKVDYLTCTSEKPPLHTIVIPEKMRSIVPGDRVLVAWVQSEAVVIDIVVTS